MLLHCIALYCIVLYCTVLKSNVPFRIELYCIELQYITLHCIVLYCIVLCFILLYCINALYCTVTYRSVPYCSWLYFIALHRIATNQNSLLPFQYSLSIGTGILRSRYGGKKKRALSDEILLRGTSYVNINIRGAIFLLSKSEPKKRNFKEFLSSRGTLRYWKEITFFRWEINVDINLCSTFSCAFFSF